MAVLWREPKLRALIVLAVARDLHRVEFADRNPDVLAADHLIGVPRKALAVDDAVAHGLGIARQEAQREEEREPILRVRRQRLGAFRPLVLHGERLRLPVEPRARRIAARAL